MQPCCSACSHVTVGTNSCQLLREHYTKQGRLVSSLYFAFLLCQYGSANKVTEATVGQKTLKPQSVLVVSVSVHFYIVPLQITGIYCSYDVKAGEGPSENIKLGKGCQTWQMKCSSDAHSIFESMPQVVAHSSAA